MFGQNKRHGSLTAIIFAILLLAGAVIYMGCKKHPHEPNQIERQLKQVESEPNAGNIGESIKMPAGGGSDQSGLQPPAATPKASLSDVIKTARGWMPVYRSWYHKPAPDFVLTDLKGSVHKLSDYHGRDVLLIFWATWCPPCQMEAPHLVELRRTISEEKLAMLAISNEKTDVVEKFVAQRGINYTVLLDRGNMPEPFGFMRIYSTVGVPCSFFIDREGKIKLATAGLLSLNAISAILQAE
jgi:peroxiredoxin